MRRSQIDGGSEKRVEVLTGAQIVAEVMGMKRNLEAKVRAINRAHYCILGCSVTEQWRENLFDGGASVIKEASGIGEQVALFGPPACLPDRLPT